MSDATRLTWIEWFAKNLQENPWWVVLSAISTVFATVVSVMAIPSILQWFFGMPKINVKLDKQDRYLLVRIFNVPVSRWVKWSRVYRQPAIVNADFEIYKAGTTILEKNIANPKISFNDETKTTIELIGWQPAKFPVVERKDGKTYLVADNFRTHSADGELLISTPRCRVEANIYYSRYCYKFHAEFDNDIDMQWHGDKKVIRTK